MTLHQRIDGDALTGLEPDLREAVVARLVQREADIVEPLGRLYGHRDDFEAWLDRLLAVVARGAARRPAELRALDAARLAEPDWFQRPRMISYMAYVDRFAGDLAGVTDKIGYLQELGVTYLHLLAVLKPRPGDSDGGYAIADYRQVDPALGGMADLEALARALREAGISLCLDFACNHTAREHHWAQRALAGDPTYQDYYHLFADRTLPDAFEQTLVDIFPTTAPGSFTHVPDMDRWVWTTFYDFQWDLNYTNPSVFADMLDAMVFLANHGVDVLRLDSAAFMWKRLGTDCRNQPETHDILRAFRALMGVVAPAVLLKAEAIVPSHHLTRYLGSGRWANKECQLTYHTTLMLLLWACLAEGDAARATGTLRQMAPIPAGTAWIAYARCHDDIGWAVLEAETDCGELFGHDYVRFVSDFYAGRLAGSFARGENFQVSRGHDVHGTNGMLASLAGLEAALADGDGRAVDLAVRRILLLFAVLYAFGGIPLIYMGDEVGLLNDPGYCDDPELAHEGRWLHRPFMDWSLAAGRGEPSSPAGRLFDGLRRLAAVRRATPVLHAGSARVTVETGNSHVLGFVREQAGDRLLVLANFAATPQALQAADLTALGFAGRLCDRLTKGHWPAGAPLALEPYQVLWLAPDGGDTAI